MRIARITYHRPPAGWNIDPQPGRHPAEDSPQTVLFLFGEQGFAADHNAWKHLKARYPQSVWIGCSGSGEIAGGQIQDEALAGVAVQFEHTTLRRAQSPVPSLQDSAEVGRRLARQLQDQEPDLKAAFVLCDGLDVDGAALIAGISETLGESVLVTGGMAGDGERFERTWVVGTGHAPATSAMAVAVGFYGAQLRVGSGCQGGWDKFGPTRRVTRAEGPVLYELDGKPALDLYKRYLGEFASGLPATGLRFPLAICMDGQPGAAVVRTILKVDEPTQSLTFAGHIPEGSLAQFMKANSDRLIAGAGHAAELAARSIHHEASTSLATLAVAVSCVGRRLVLGERTEDELDAVLSALPANTCQIGFYSYGEFAPHDAETTARGLSALHNQTMTVTVFQEAP